MLRLLRTSGKRAAGAALIMSLLPLLNANCSVDETRQEALLRFQEANQHYAEGKFDEALKTYLEVAETGFASGPLFYNIGNCYYRQSNIGKSILFYERARLFMPGDEDLAHNLELSQLKVIDKIGVMPEFWLIRLWRGSVHLMSPALLSILLTLSWLGFVASLIVRLLGDSAWTRWSAPTAKVCLLVLLISVTCLGSQWWTRASTTRAIVTAESVRAFGSPGGGGVEVFVLHKGVKVGIDEIRDGWYEIVLADGNHGWVRTDGLEII